MQTRTDRAVRVFLAEDSLPIRHRLHSLLAGPAMVIVGEGETPARCIAAILAAQPDVVVLDVQLEAGSGLEVLRAVRASRPEVAFVVFSSNSAAAYRRRYLEEGALAFLDKNAEFDQLPGAVLSAAGRTVH